MAQYDIALRHVTRRHAEDLARALLPPGLSLEVVGWLDTQVTNLERRLDPWGHNLQEEIRAMMQADDYEVLRRSPILRAVLEEGEQKVKEKAKEELLRDAFADQLGRDATADEQAALAKRAQELGARQVLRALFKLHGDALVAWLLGNGTGPDRVG